MGAESNTPPAGDGAKLQRPSSRTNNVRAALWRFLVLCTEPFFSRLRDYLLAPLIRRADGIEPLIGLLHPKFDGHAAETRTATECIQHQIVHMEFQSRNFAKQLAHLESMLANQLARLESQAGSVHGRIELLVDRNALVAGGDLLARTPNGYVLAPADGPGFARFLAEAAVWEQATCRLLDLTLRKGMTFVDVGANVGLHTLQGARRVGPTGAVIALEPAPNLFRLLQKSIRINDMEGVCNCINIALFSAEIATSEGSRYCEVNSANQPVSEDAKAEFQVKTTCLDNVLQGVRRVDVVRLDAGGAELVVLEGMNHVLAGNRDIVLIVEYRVPQLKRIGISPVEWFGRFFAHGLALFAFEEQTGTWRQIAEDRAGKLPSTTVAFVRSGTNQWAVLKQHEV